MKLYESLEEIKLIKKTALFKELKALRMKLAEEQHVFPYMILYDKTLIDIVLKKPKTKEELIKCHGMGEKRYAKYGKLLLDIILKYV